MKLLWLSHFIPYPPRGGAHQRSFNLLREAARRFETTLIAINHEGHPAEVLADYAAKLKEFCKSVEVWELPFAWRGAGWWARLALNVPGPYPFGCRARWSRELCERWKRALENHAGSLVHFDSIDLAPYFAPASSFHKVLNHHNCESAMVRRRAQLEPGFLKRKFLEIEARKLEKLERTVCSKFDMNLAVSALDAEILRGHDSQARFCDAKRFQVRFGV